MSAHAPSMPDVGIRLVWINLLGERAQPTLTREPPEVHGLAEPLDELVA